MGTRRLPYQEKRSAGGRRHWALTKTELASLNETLLGLGEISAESREIGALAAVFDLEGFTDFCSQPDPQLVVPQFLDDFLSWLFGDIRTRFTFKTRSKDVLLWGRLPFFGKFMGDGVLLLWDTQDDTAGGIANVALSLYEVCQDYAADFASIHSERYSRLPKRLRVGIARGRVLSVGRGRDYVGPCINTAARLQKLGALSFALSRRGLDPVEGFDAETQEGFVVKKTKLRGIGEDELVIVRKKEFEALQPKDAELFR